MRLLLLLAFLVTCNSQQLVEDDFTCPDEFLGFYPHLISCDKYWHCQDGYADLRICENGLAFVDNDDTFTKESCEEIPLVECGERNRLEEPIGTRNCPRLYGTFPDPEDCGVFWKCIDGKSNRQACPPGLAYDQDMRVCTWADQVPECSSNQVIIDEEGGSFQCPANHVAGVFTKHAHPTDCRQYFLCIAGIPREYGCPLGSVFDEVSGSGIDGKCTSPEDVPECANFYEGVDLDSRDLIGSGFDTGRTTVSREQPRSSSSGRRRTGSINSVSSPNSIPTASINKNSRDRVREQSRPAPPSLQAIVDSNVGNPSRNRPNTPQPSRSRPNTPQSRPSPTIRQESVTLPPRLSVSSIRPRPNAVSEVRTPSPSRLQILTDRPGSRTTLPRRPVTTNTEGPKSTQSRLNSGSIFSTAGRQSFNTPIATTASRPPTTAAPFTGEAQPVDSDLFEGDGLPDPVRAKEGPNGEEYYYYYYYYDDEEGGEEADVAS